MVAHAVIQIRWWPDKTQMPLSDTNLLVNMFKYLVRVKVNAFQLIQTFKGFLFLFRKIVADLDALMLLI